MSVPLKFREIGDFHEYYSGSRKAPYLTIFVGGNHEASNHLWELFYGGWVAPNIYYIGAANVLRLGPLRIAGLSGIWKGYNYNKPHHERLPYNQDDVKSIYHVRELDVRKLMQVCTQVDVGISHDWPRGVEWHGNWKALFAKKDLFEADARAGILGSLAAKYAMDRLRPPHWFSAHLHCKFSAVVDHENVGTKEPQVQPVPDGHAAANGTLQGSSNGITNSDEILLDIKDDSSENRASKPVRNTDEIDIDMDDDVPGAPPSVNEANNHNGNAPPPAVEAEPVTEDLRAQLPASFARPAPTAPPPPLPPPAEINNKTTLFLALDKCLPNRKFLQILEIEPISQSGALDEISRPLRLLYDKEWLAITRVFASSQHFGSPNASNLPNKGEATYRPLIEAEEKWVEENLISKDKMTIPENFEITAPIYDPNVGIRVMEQPKEYTNPQTVAFCEMLGVENPFHASEEEREERKRVGARPDEQRNAGRGRGRGGGFGGGRGKGRGRGRDRGRGFR